MSSDTAQGVPQDAAPLEREIRTDIVAAENPERPIRRTMRRIRAWLTEHPRVEIAYRVGVAIVGAVMVVGGLILVPLPGPGWLVVFLGFAVLGTEFHWAHRISSWLKGVLDRFWTWWRARRADKARKTSG